MRGVRFRIVAIVVAAVLIAGFALGCTGEPPTGPVSPGVTVGSLGGIEVVGYLADDGGVWTVLDADPTAADTTDPAALAVLVAGSVDEAGIAALEGRYIWAAGTSSDTSAEVPQIKVDGIDTAVEPN